MKTLGTFIWQTLDWISFLTGPDPKHFSAGRGQQKAWKHRMMAADLVKDTVPGGGGCCIRE